MNNQTRILACILLATLTVSAFATDIYRRVNEDGVVEFSDTPFQNSEPVTVRPNVVPTAPYPARTRPTEDADAASAAAPAATQTSNLASQQNSQLVRARTPQEREVRRRVESKDSRTRRNYKPDNSRAERDPNPGRATRNAIRNANP
jgi:hypothetical protein